MYRILVISFIFCVLFYPLKAQILPEAGSKLCWRLIGFRFPAERGAIKYKVEIAKGACYTESDFGKSVISSSVSKKNRTIIEVPSFGQAYTWRTVAVAKNNIKTKSVLHHFSTKISPDVDTNITRLRIIKNAEKYKDAYVFVDGARALYDMKGAPVWFLPNTDSKLNEDVRPRDLKITQQGTITFTSGYLPFEIAYNGDLLWQYKSNAVNGSRDTFHHEFTRLSNGHYMAMVLKPASVTQDSITYHFNINYLIEYDANNKIVWSWNSLAYINNPDNSDLLTRKNEDGQPLYMDLHENSFYFDELHKSIYVSVRNADRIIKIKYPEGNILNTYGAIDKQAIAHKKNELFCDQHSCRVSQKGYLYLFNNNTCGPSHIPTIVMLQEPAKGSNGLKKIWEFQCTIEDPAIAAEKDLSFHSGGNVTELHDLSFFVSMGLPYCKVFIVNRDKKILWSAIAEKYDPEAKKWGNPIELYRASIIASHKELERLIWHGEYSLSHS